MDCINLKFRGILILLTLSSAKIRNMSSTKQASKQVGMNLKMYWHGWGRAWERWVPKDWKDSLWQEEKLMHAQKWAVVACLCKQNIVLQNPLCRAEKELEIRSSCQDQLDKECCFFTINSIYLFFSVIKLGSRFNKFHKSQVSLSPLNKRRQILYKFWKSHQFS